MRQVGFRVLPPLQIKRIGLVAAGPGVADSTPADKSQPWPVARFPRPGSLTAADDGAPRIGCHSHHAVVVAAGLSPSSV